MMRRLLQMAVASALFVAVVRTVAPGDAPLAGWQAAAVIAAFVAATIANLYIATKTKQEA